MRCNPPIDYPNKQHSKSSSKPKYQSEIVFSIAWIEQGFCTQQYYQSHDSLSNESIVEFRRIQEQHTNACFME